MQKTSIETFIVNQVEFEQSIDQLRDSHKRRLNIHC